MLDLGHENIPLTPIVGARQLGIFHESQHFAFIITKTLQLC